jgi:hypothetical protein
MDNMPNFRAWNLEELIRFAEEAYRQMCADADAKEQLRMDNKDLSKINRQLLIKEKI